LATALLGERADLVTGFPRQRVESWGEKMLVPFFPWASLTFVSLGLAYRIRLPFIAVAVGQVMLFTRKGYEKIGGHASLGDAVVDDVLLARRIKAAGLRWRVARVSDLIMSRMYRSSREAVNGFTKNLFAAFDYRIIPYVFIFLWLLVLFVFPLLVMLAAASGASIPAQPEQLLTCVSLSLLIWLMPALEIRIPPWLILFYPMIVMSSVVIAFRSLIFSLAGKLTWKGRPLAIPRWKWF
jgi:chlorobactene glucosyltransferase